MDSLTTEQLAELNPSIDEEQEKLELEKKIELLEMSRLNLRLQPFVFDRLQKQAEFYNISIEDHATNVLVSSLETLVGAPHISGPSNLSGVVTKKIMGPTNSVTRA